jgi:hypothetical protein
MGASGKGVRVPSPVHCMGTQGTKPGPRHLVLDCRLSGDGRGVEGTLWELK